MIKILNLKSVILLEFQNIQTFLSEEVFVIKKVKNTVSWRYIISDLKGEEIIEKFYEMELQKINQKDFRIERVIKRKGDKLYVKWKGGNSSFYNWIDTKDIV